MMNVIKKMFVVTLFLVPAVVMAAASDAKKIIRAADVALGTKVPQSRLNIRSLRMAKGAYCPESLPVRTKVWTKMNTFAERDLDINGEQLYTNSIVSTAPKTDALNSKSGWMIERQEGGPSVAEPISALWIWVDQE
jgi:hypothetical protein